LAETVKPREHEAIVVPLFTPPRSRTHMAAGFLILAVTDVIANAPDADFAARSFPGGAAALATPNKEIAARAQIAAVAIRMNMPPVSLLDAPSIGATLLGVYARLTSPTSAPDRVRDARRPVATNCATGCLPSRGSLICG
jgi:hypothetical protein